VVDTARPPDATSGRLTVDLQARIDPRVEWRQIFQESWRYQRDFFYDPNTHGADWDAVWDRYEPLVEHVRHRADLNYIIDKVNGELAVGHSFVGGGDMPDVESPRSAALGADLEAAAAAGGSPGSTPTRAGTPPSARRWTGRACGVREGHYLLAVDGTELRTEDDPYRLLEGTAGTPDPPAPERSSLHGGCLDRDRGAHRRETALRQRAWVEDNRRLVDELSGGRLAYVWVPNTGQPGVSPSTGTTSPSRTGRAPSSTSASTAAASWTTTWWTS
jgi:tricorn protease